MEAFPSKDKRLAIFMERLKTSPPAASAGEAYRQLCDILNAVEDEMTPIPYDLDNSRTDGRMYPPLEDNRHTVPGFAGVTRYRSRGHDTFIGANGSIEIRLARSESLLLSKPGRDGRGVWSP